jgi:hypothetical protein
MRDTTKNLIGGAACAAALGLAGCLERDERITVEADGTVVIEARFTTTNEADLWGADAMPSLAGGWLVEESIKDLGDGDQRFHVEAEAEFPPAFDLPSNYAVPGDPDEDLYLQFPTTVTIEERPDGIYYHFHRRYPARSYARIESLRERLVDERLKGKMDKPLEEFTHDERVYVIRCFADFEAAKMLTFARAAVLEVTPDLPQDAWLAVYADIHRFKAELEVDRIARIVEVEDVVLRDEAFEKEADLWEERTLKRLEDAVRERCGYSGRQMRDFLRRYERKVTYLRITEGLGVDTFDIEVVMPGEIIGANTSKVSGNTVSWEFGGSRFRDQDVELMASSRLDYGN